MIYETKSGYGYEGYDVYTVTYLEDDVQKYGCACTSNDKDQKFSPHKFGKSDNEFLKFPSWICYDGSESLTHKETCHVKHGKNVGSGLVPDACFPNDQEDVNIVFGEATVYGWGAFCLEFYILLHILGAVILCFPVEFIRYKYHSTYEAEEELIRYNKCIYGFCYFAPIILGAVGYLILIRWSVEIIFLRKLDKIYKIQ